MPVRGHNIVHVFASGDAADLACHPRGALVSVPACFIDSDQQSLAGRTDDQLRLTLTNVQYMNFQCTGRPRSGRKGGTVRTALRRIAINRAPIPAVWFAAAALIRRGGGIRVTIVNGCAVCAKQAHIVSAIIQERTEGHHIISAGGNGCAGRDLFGRASAACDVVNPHRTDIQSIGRGVVQLHPFRRLSDAIDGDEFIDQNFARRRRSQQRSCGFGG